VHEPRRGGDMTPSEPSSTRDGAAAPASSATQWGAVWAIYAGGLICGAFIGKVPPALPALREDLGLSLVETGFIATMLNVLGGLIGMFAGVFADRFGHKRFAIAGLAAMCAGGLLGAAAPAYAVLLLSRFLEGFGFILTTVAGVALLTGVTRASDRPRTLSMWSTYMPAGGGLALLAAPLVIALFGWRGYWVVLALTSLVCLVLIVRVVPSPPFGGQVRSLRLASESLAQPGSLALSLVFLCYTAQWAAVMIWLPTFAMAQAGVGITAASLLTAGMVGINIPGNLLGGWLVGRGVPRARLIVIASVCQALAAAGIFLDLLPDAGRYASCLVFSFIGGLIPASVLTGVPLHARSREHIGTTNGMIMQSSMIGQFISPILIAWLVTRHETWSAGYGAMLGFALLALVAGLATGRFEARLNAKRHTAPG